MKRYQLRAWRAGHNDSLLAEDHVTLDAAHAEQQRLKLLGYFSWVLDRVTDMNVSCFLPTPQKA